MEIQPVVTFTIIETRIRKTIGSQISRKQKKGKGK